MERTDGVFLFRGPLDWTLKAEVSHREKGFPSSCPLGAYYVGNGIFTSSKRTVVCLASQEGRYGAGRLHQAKRLEWRPTSFKKKL